MKTRKVYCRDCRHFCPMGGYRVFQRCEAGPLEETYWGVTRQTADPQKKNANNDCPDFSRSRLAWWILAVVTLPPVLALAWRLSL